MHMLNYIPSSQVIRNAPLTYCRHSHRTITCAIYACYMWLLLASIERASTFMSYVPVGKVSQYREKPTSLQTSISRIE